MIAGEESFIAGKLEFEGRFRAKEILIVTRFTV
jgi:hypothetical protein